MGHKMTLMSIQSQKIRAVEHLRNSCYSRLDPEHAIEFYTKKYVNPLKNYIDITHSSLADCGCGYGWMGFAYIMNGGQKVVAIDVDLPRLEAAQEIAQVLGVNARIEFRHETITDLSLGNREADICVSLGTLEHLENKKYDERNVRGSTLRALGEISRVSSRLILISTPNNWFPIDSHDTGLLFAHWLPQPLRTAYAKMFKRLDTHEYTNRFLSHRIVEGKLKDFKLITPALCYKDMHELRATYPVYCPYGGANGFLSGKSKKILLYDYIYRLLGKHSRFFLPVIEGIYQRVEK